MKLSDDSQHRGKESLRPAAISTSAQFHDDSVPSYSKSCPGKRNCGKKFAQTYSEEKRSPSQFAEFTTDVLGDN
jgi:hypothetical protein